MTSATTCAYIADKLGEADGILIVDDTGVVKKGTTSAGVQRQYSGTAGRTENCQIGVFTAYASARGRALVDRELYLPKSWTEDRERCRTARVPDEREFATKGELARHMVLRAVASPLPIAWVTADSAYGQENRFRRLLEQSGVGYVLAVPKSRFCVSCSRIEVLFAQAPDEVWEKISCGNGEKGPPRLPLDSGAAAGRRRVRLSGRGPSPDAVGTGPAQHQQARRDRPLPRLHPLQVTVQELVRVAGARWAIEECEQVGQPGPSSSQWRRFGDSWQLVVPGPRT
ncbi:IS701 family transposase [Streptomyces sp. Ru87]|uniref:IS701 family transposase n=1 Tax=Streptomyces sp. Ru87 TaxID=2044307 RepID=UPI00211D16F0|nr:IS701 family transposase [Streptomyces sp. Ru87]